MPVVIAVNCSPSSFTDSGAGAGVAVCVIVTVGAGVGVSDGDAVGEGSCVAPLVGSLVGEGEIGAGVTTVTKFTLDPPEDEAESAPKEAGETESVESESIHLPPPVESDSQSDHGNAGSHDQEWNKKC
jgi:hypothetical protein